MLLKDLKKGEYFKRTPTAKAVYIKGDYDRGTKTFSCIDAEDINKEIFIESGEEVARLGFARGYGKQ